MRSEWLKEDRDSWRLCQAESAAISKTFRRTSLGFPRIGRRPRWLEYSGHGSKAVWVWGLVPGQIILDFTTLAKMFDFILI